MQLSDFDYNLPEDLIATEPAQPRDHSRLLVVDRKTGELSHKHFYDLPEFLQHGDLLVLNNTKVFPARLFGKRTPEGREFEIVLLQRLSLSKWTCLVRPGKKIKARTQIFFENGNAHITRLEDLSFEIEFEESVAKDFFHWIERVGKMPLPPYIKRAAEEKDLSTYQTVFAEHVGSVAAPTAGLHFTQDLLKKIKAKGVEVREVTLHVGYGTFSPIQTDQIEDHKMHSEEYEVPADLPALIEKTKRDGKRVIPVGTTALRTLESFQTMGLKGSTNIFITPGYSWKVMDSLITNFHIPKSSLFVLVCAILGMDKAKEVYLSAVQNRYRFYSYGDAMLVL